MFPRAAAARRTRHGRRKSLPGKDIRVCLRPAVNFFPNILGARNKPGPPAQALSPQRLALFRRSAARPRRRGHGGTQSDAKSKRRKGFVLSKAFHGYFVVSRDGVIASVFSKPGRTAPPVKPRMARIARIGVRKRPSSLFSVIRDIRDIRVIRGCLRRGTQSGCYSLVLSTISAVVPCPPEGTLFCPSCARHVFRALAQKTGPPGSDSPQGRARLDTCPDRPGSARYPLAFHQPSSLAISRPDFKPNS